MKKFTVTKCFARIHYPDKVLRSVTDNEIIGEYDDLESALNKGEQYTLFMERTREDWEIQQGHKRILTQVTVWETYGTQSYTILAVE